MDVPCEMFSGQFFSPQDYPSGLPQQPPPEATPGRSDTGPPVGSDTGPPVKKSKFRMTQEKAAAKKKKQAIEVSGDPEEMLDSE